MLDAVAAAGAIPPTVLDTVLSYYFPPGLTAASSHPLAFRARLETWDSDRLLDSIVPLGRMLFGRRDALPDVVSLPVPTLVMTGTADVARPVYEGRRMAHALGCPFVELPNAGHLPTLDAGEAVTAHLMEFLDGVLSPARPRRPSQRIAARL
jgi:pimeloyl-ACP methyl ester carboxylesterase